MVDLQVPATILRGDPTVPRIVAATDRLAELMPHAELVVVPESRDCGVDPVGTAREIRGRLVHPG
jgi:hypothetical protein